MDKATKKFRKRFFTWSFIIIAFVIIYPYLCMLFNPLVNLNESKDIGIFEDWLGISFPEGSIVRKMQYYYPCTDPDFVTLIIDIPSNKLKQFQNKLPKEYVLEDTDFWISYDIKDQEFDVLEIFSAQNGYNSVFIDRECPTDKVINLFIKNIRNINFSLGRITEKLVAESTSFDGKNTIKLYIRDTLYVSAMLYSEGNMGGEIYYFPYTTQPLTVEWINNDSVMICGIRFSIAGYQKEVEEWYNSL